MKLRSNTILLLFGVVGIALAGLGYLFYTKYQELNSKLNAHNANMSAIFAMSQDLKNTVTNFFVPRQIKEDEELDKDLEEDLNQIVNPREMVEQPRELIIEDDDEESEYDPQEDEEESEDEESESEDEKLIDVSNIDVDLEPVEDEHEEREATPESEPEPEHPLLKQAEKIAEDIEEKKEMIEEIKEELEKKKIKLEPETKVEDNVPDLTDFTIPEDEEKKKIKLEPDQKNSNPMKMLGKDESKKSPKVARKFTKKYFRSKFKIDKEKSKTFDNLFKKNKGKLSIDKFEKLLSDEGFKSL